MATCSSADSVLEAATLIKENGIKLNKFVNGTEEQTVQLGTGDPTPTLRNMVANAVSVVADAMEESITNDVEANQAAIAALQSGKADKVSGATAGDIATLNASGNLVDSGVKPGDKADKVSSATNGHLAGLNSSGNLTDSGITSSDVALKSTDIATLQTNKANKVSNAVAGDIAVLDASGDLVDFGKNPSEITSLAYYTQSALVNNGYMSYNSGSITDSDTDIGYKYSNEIAITEAMKGATVGVQATATLAGAFVAFYNADGNFISALAGNENTSGSIAVPNNATKMRLGAKTSTGNSFRAAISTNSALTAVAQKLGSYENGIANKTYLKWDTSILTNNGYIHPVSGEFFESDFFKYSNAILVPKALIGATISVQASATTTSVFVAFYSNNYTYIGGLDASESTSGSIAVPDNAWFMRFCAKTYDNGEFHAEVKLQSCLDAAQKNANNYDAYHWTILHLTNYGYIGPTNGVIADTAGTSTEFSYSDAISTSGIKGATIVISAGATLGGAFVAFYDAAGKFISALSGAESKTGSIMVPMNAAAMRLSGRTNYSFDAKVYVYNSVRALDSYLSSINNVRTFDKSVLVNAGYIKPDGSINTEYTAYKYSNFITVDFLNIKVFSNARSSGCYVAFYDESNIFISGAGSVDTPTDYISVDVPKKAKKCRFSSQVGENLHFYAVTEGRLSSLGRLVDESISKSSGDGAVSCIDVMQDLVLASGKTVVLYGDSITAGIGSTGMVSYTETVDGTTYGVYGNGPNYPGAGAGYQTGALIYQTSARKYYESIDGNGWSQQIKAYLEKKFDCSIRNFGCSGIGSTQLQSFALEKAQSIDADIAIVAIGTNNRFGITKDALYSSLVNIYTSLSSNGIATIAVTPIPATVTSETSYDYDFHVEDVNFIVKKACVACGIPCIDMFSKLLSYCRYTGTNLDSLFADGLHPNDAGYTVIARLMLEELGLPMSVEGATW